MSQTPVEEESEILQDFSRIVRSATMAGMQIRESRERQQQNKAQQSQAAERLSRERREQVSHTLHRDVHSEMFWQHAGNRRIADNLTVAQYLATEGDAKANSSYMLMADKIRDVYGLSVEAVGNDLDGQDRYDALLAALDDANAAGRQRDEAYRRDMSAAEERNREGAEREEAEELVEAARHESAEIDATPEEYLDALSPEQRESMLDDFRNDIDNSDLRQERLDSVALSLAEKSEAEADSDNARADHDEREAKEESEDADRKRVEETTHMSEARPRSTDEQLDTDMDRHLDTVAKTDPQAAESRRTQMKAHPEGGKNFKQSTMDSKQSKAKTHAKAKTADRERSMSR